MTDGEKIKYISEHTDGLERDVQLFFNGAASCMRFFHDYYGGKEPIYPSEFENIFIKWASQWADVKEVDE